MSSTNTGATGISRNTDNTARTPDRRISTETKSSLKTTELVAYVAAVIAILIASAVVDDNPDFGAQEAWKFITWLTIGYMISRGLAKSGSRDYYDDDRDRH
jgi:hypothetical protein